MVSQDHCGLRRQVHGEPLVAHPLPVTRLFGLVLSIRRRYPWQTPLVSVKLGCLANNKVGTEKGEDHQQCCEHAVLLQVVLQTSRIVSSVFTYVMDERPACTTRWIKATSPWVLSSSSLTPTIIRINTLIKKVSQAMNHPIFTRSGW